MELGKIINDTENFTRRVQGLLGPQVFGDSSTLVAELSRVVGVLAESTLITEGKRPNTRKVDLGHDMADVLYMLIAISTTYNIDIEHDWNEWIAQTHTRLNDDELIKTIRDRLNAARAKRQKN
jgi:hypothetical protein